MRTAFELNQSRDQHEAGNPTGGAIAARDRVLQIACGLFAEAGFHGTHLREICRHAGVNVAEVYYHFRSKEGLYQAVMMEAGRRLSGGDKGFLDSCAELPPEQRLLKLTESLLERLSARRAWIAKLLARELVEPACGAHTYVASGLERDYVQLQAVIRDFVGADAGSDAIRLHVLSVIGQCVFYCLAGDNPHHPLTELAAGLPSRACLARFLTQRALGSCEGKGMEPEVSR